MYTVEPLHYSEHLKYTHLR